MKDNIIFNYFPVFLVQDNFYSLSWKVKNAFFVYISGGVGFKRKQGTKFIKNSNNITSYKLYSFGFRGIEVKQIFLEYKVVNKYQIKPELIERFENLMNPQVNTLPLLPDKINFSIKIPNTQSNIKFNKENNQNISEILKEIRDCTSQENLSIIKEKYTHNEQTY